MAWADRIAHKSPVSYLIFNIFHAVCVMGKSPYYTRTAYTGVRQLPPISRTDAIEAQRAYRDSWYWQFVRWHKFAQFLTVATVALSTLIATRPKLLHISDDWYDGLAALLAFLTALSAAFMPYEKGERRRRAWMELSIVITRYDADETYTLNDVPQCL